MAELISDGVLLGAARQEQRGAERVAVFGGKGDIVDENVVELSVSHRDFPFTLWLRERGLPKANWAFGARA